MGCFPARLKSESYDVIGADVLLDRFLFFAMGRADFKDNPHPLR